MTTQLCQPLGGSPLDGNMSQKELAWLEPHIDPLALEAVRRFLDGESAGPLDARMPAPEVIAARARARGDRGAAVDLAIVAIRVVTGIAWWQIGGRFALANTAAPVGAIATWAAPARRRFEKLVDVGVKANMLAPTNERGLTFGMIAQRLHAPAEATPRCPDITEAGPRAAATASPRSHARRTSGPPAATTNVSRQPVSFTLPRHVELPRASGELAGMRGEVRGSTLIVQPTPGTCHIEQVLARILIDVLENDVPSWLRPFQFARSDVAEAGGILKVTGPTISTPNWTDTYYFSADLAHRLFFERRWAAGLPCVWILANAGTGDLLQRGTQRRDSPNRTNLAKAINLTRRWEQMADPWRGVGAAAIVNLFTVRTHDVASLSAASRGRNHPRADDVLERSFRRAGPVVAAWGSSVVRDDVARPSEVLDLARTAGSTVHGMYSTYGGRRVRWLSNGQPRYTMHLSADAEPVPLEELLADNRTPLP